MPDGRKFSGAGTGGLQVGTDVSWRSLVFQVPRVPEICWVAVQDGTGNGIVHGIGVFPDIQMLVFGFVHI